jgi:hypothetical protein
MIMDVTMTATRRPDLVSTTMASFQKMLFDRLTVRTFYLNIDPVWGTEQQGEEVEAVARKYFRNVEVRRPLKASYGGAVKWLWEQPQTEWFLHMEDDWIMTNPISLRRLSKQMASGASQIKLANWSRIGRYKRPPTLGLCPLFSSTQFARLAAAKMNAEFDPDKQFRNHTNMPLEAAVSGHYAVYFGGAFTPRSLIDIGRDWRQDRNIEKQIVNGASVWTGENT